MLTLLKDFFFEKKLIYNGLLLIGHLIIYLIVLNRYTVPWYSIPGTQFYYWPLVSKVAVYRLAISTLIQ